MFFSSLFSSHIFSSLLKETLTGGKKKKDKGAKASESSSEESTKTPKTKDSKPKHGRSRDPSGARSGKVEAEKSKKSGKGFGKTPDAKDDSEAEKIRSLLAQGYTLVPPAPKPKTKTFLTCLLMRNRFTPKPLLRHRKENTEKGRAKALLDLTGL